MQAAQNQSNEPAEAQELSWFAIRQPTVVRFLERRLWAPDGDAFAVALDAVCRLHAAMAVADGRAGRADLKIGVCGEHGGDPSSVAFFHGAGLDYVSCSPYRVPVARLAAAHAALAEKGATGSGTA